MIRPVLVTTLLGLAAAARAQVTAPSPAYPDPFPATATVMATAATPPASVATTTTTTVTTTTPAATDNRPLPPPRVGPGPGPTPPAAPTPTSTPAPAPPAYAAAPAPAPVPPPPPGRVTYLSPPTPGQPYPSCPCPVPYIAAPYAGQGAPLDMVPPPPPRPALVPVPPPPPLRLAPAYAIDPVNRAVPATVPPLPIDGPRGRDYRTVAPAPTYQDVPWPPTEAMPVPPDVGPATPLPVDGVSPVRASAPVAALPPDRPVRAALDTTTLDVFASRLRIDAGGPDELGDTTVGGRARIGLAPGLFASGEYQKNGFDQANGRLDIRQVRAGLGGRFVLARDLPSAWGTVEYTEWRLRDRFTGVNGAPQDVIETLRGPGLHAGTRLPLGPVVGLYGEGGYVWMRNGTYALRGPEWLGGLDLMPLGTRYGNLRLFAEYRYSDLDFDFRSAATAQARGVSANNDVKFGDFRAGARIGLGR